MILINCLCTCIMLTILTLSIPSHCEGIHGLKSSQACCSLQRSFVVQFLCSVLGWDVYASTPVLNWLTQEDICTPFNNSGTNIYTTSQSTQLIWSADLHSPHLSKTDNLLIPFIFGYTCTHISWAHCFWLSALSLPSLCRFTNQSQVSIKNYTIFSYPSLLRVLFN